MSRPPSRSPQRPPQGSGSGRPAPAPAPSPAPASGNQGSAESVNAKEDPLQYLFDRPGEPVFLPKGDQNAIFDMPTEYIVG